MPTPNLEPITEQAAPDYGEFQAFETPEASASGVQTALPRVPEPTDDPPLALRDDSLDAHDIPAPTWRVLVVDDDAEVHHATRFSLAHTPLVGRSIELLHAYSAAEAAALLQQEADIAVILLDVVMEDNEAGLRLVDKIRNDLQLHQPRIILRTGQPGHAPEIDVIKRYDINDYRNKSELTQTRLLTSLTAALRSYDQIRTIDRARQGLHVIIDGTNRLLACRTQQAFARHGLEQIQRLTGAAIDGVVVSAADSDLTRSRVVCAVGRFDAAACPLSVVDEHGMASLRAVLANRRSSVAAGRMAVYFESARGPMLAYAEWPAASIQFDERIMELFCANIGLCADNAALIARLNDAAYRDELTGLPNHAGLVAELERRFYAAHGRMLLAVLDIDNFNAVVDTLGQQAADDLLRAIARRLTSRFGGESAFVARVSSDSFAVLGPEELLPPERLRGIFSVPFQIDSLMLPIAASIGMAALGGTCLTPMQTLSGAYAALKRAKQRQHNRIQRYTSEMSRAQMEQTQVLQDLRGAFDRNELHLVFQPQLRLDDRRVVGLETLLRWRKPDGSSVPPDRFIPVAESSGLISPIGAWVFRSACEYRQRLLRLGMSEVVVAVNVSVAQLRDAGFPSMVEYALRDFDVPRGAMEVEITEGMAMESIDLLLTNVDMLKDLGLRVALDDFGTGFSSLSYLQRLNVDRLKLDRSFVSEIGHCARGERIARTVVELGRHLDLDVLAEGVENGTQAEYLARIGCHTAQGYYYAHPMDFESVEVWLADR